MAECSIELWSVGPYSLGASVRFLELFARAAYEGWRPGSRAAWLRGLGPSVGVHGGVERTFRGPKSLATLDRFPGLTARKVKHLRRLGREAAGETRAAHLRSLPEEVALRRLEDLPSIGPFSAGLVLLRGPARRTSSPPKSRGRGGLSQWPTASTRPTAEELRRLALGWRPYRTWVSLHLWTMLGEEIGEIG